MMNSFRIILTWKEILDTFFAEKNFGKGCARLVIKCLACFAYGVVLILGPRTILQRR